MLRFLAVLIAILMQVSCWGLCVADESHSIVVVNGGWKDKDYYLGFVFRVNNGWNLYAGEGDIKLTPLFGGSVAVDALDIKHDRGVKKVFEVIEGYSETKVVFPERAIYGVKIKDAARFGVERFNFEISYKVCSSQMCTPYKKHFMFSALRSDAKKLDFLYRYFYNMPHEAILYKGGDINTKSFLDGQKFSWKDVVIKIKNIVDLPMSFSVAVVFAFLGGLLLNLMPCVLPVISIKMTSLAQFSNLTSKQIRVNLLLTSLGIMLFLLGIALAAIILKSVGLSFNWGMHFQNSYFVLAMVFLVMLLLAYSLSYISFNVGGGVLSKLGDGKMDSILVGFFTASMATPCIAPFLGGAVAYALKLNSVFAVLTIFLMIGCGLAFPYIAFCFKPSLAASIGKYAKLSRNVKDMTNALLVLTLLWVLWILIGQTSYFVGLITLVTLCLLFYRLKKNTLLGKPNKRVIVDGVIMFVVISSVIFGMGQMVRRSDRINKEVWKPFDESKIESYVKDGKVVIVDVTADWCITCKVNKLVAFGDKTLEYIKNHEDIVAMQADITVPNEEVSKYLQKYGSYGIPFNIVYSEKFPEGLKLSTVLTSGVVIKTLSDAMEGGDFSDNKEDVIDSEED